MSWFQVFPVSPQNLQKSFDRFAVLISTTVPPLSNGFLIAACRVCHAIKQLRYGRQTACYAALSSERITGQRLPHASRKSEKRKGCRNK
jgi:hypothetical protein